MLRISKASLNALEASSWPGFVAGLTDELLEEYPDELEPYPEQVRTQMVANMVARARARWNLQSQEALAAYCELALSVAPNFDEDPDVQGALRSQADAETVVLEIGDLVPDKVWERVEAHAACLPLYVPSDLMDAPLAKRVEAAAKLLLEDRIPPNALAEAAARAVAIAERLGFSDDDDAGLVILASQAVWGRALFDTDFPDWVRKVLNENYSAQRKVESIRIALADAADLIV